MQCVIKKTFEAATGNHKHTFLMVTEYISIGKYVKNLNNKHLCLQLTDNINNSIIIHHVQRVCKSNLEGHDL